MGVQKLHAFEKTSIQARHSIKRLEMFIDITRDDNERVLAKGILQLFENIRALIPEEYQDTDLHKEE